MEKTFHMLLYRAFHAERNRLRPYLSQIGLEVGQPKLLGYLADNGACQQSQLADHFDIDSAAVSRTLDTLERGGFLMRQPNVQSRRCNLVELTPKGREAHRQWQRHCLEIQQIMLAGFSPEEQAQFADFLSRVYHNFRSEQEGDSCAI